MSRFSGWTEQSVSRIVNKEIAPKKRETKDYVTPIVNALRIMGVEPVTEYKFLIDRRFRFDIAIPENKIAVEFEGGIYSKGRHTRGKGYSNDAKKYNLAVMAGWKLLRFTSEDAKKVNWEFEIAKQIYDLSSTK
jgi:hypothetical protein